MNSQPPGSKRARVDATISGIDLFYRDAPAPLLLAQDSWRLAFKTIELACLKLSLNGGPRADRRVRDLVLLACVRRSIITAEAIVQLLARGLEEPAHGLTRTLIETETAVESVASDPTDRLAKRLAANGYKIAERHLKAQLESPDFGTAVLSRHGGRAERERLLALVSDALAQKEFEPVLEELLKDQHWHGHRSARKAFEAVGRVGDYLMTFGTASGYLHATNLTPDLVSDTEGRVSLRALIQRDPERIFSQLGYTTLKLFSILERWTTDRGIPDEVDPGQPCVLRGEDGSETPIGPMRALGLLVIEQFRLHPGTPNEPVT